MNETAEVIVSPDAMKGGFYSERRFLHSIATAWPDIPEERLVLVGESCQIPTSHLSEGRAPDVLQIMARIRRAHPMPKGNQHLFIRDANGGYTADDFRHELALYIDGLVFTGCAHSGLENILSA